MADDANPEYNAVFAELPGTETSVLYNPETRSLYIRLTPDLPGYVETQTLIASPRVNVDLHLGQAVGIEIVLGVGDAAVDD